MTDALNDRRGIAGQLDLNFLDAYRPGDAVFPRGDAVTFLKDALIQGHQEFCSLSGPTNPAQNYADELKTRAATVRGFQKNPQTNDPETVNRAMTDLIAAETCIVLLDLKKEGHIVPPRTLSPVGQKLFAETFTSGSYVTGHSKGSTLDSSILADNVGHPLFRSGLYNNSIAPADIRDQKTQALVTVGEVTEALNNGTRPENWIFQTPGNGWSEFIDNNRNLRKPDRNKQDQALEPQT